MLTLRMNAPQFERFAADVDQFFGTLLRGSPASTPARPGTPAINGWEEGESLVIEAEVPGLSLEQVNVTVQGDELTIKGERPAPTSEPNWLRRERWHGSFERTLTLPFPVDADHVEASLNGGILTIRLPKAASARARKVEVRATPAVHNSPSATA